MTHEPDLETVALNIDSMIEDLLNRLDDIQADREADLPEVEELTARYYWTRTWGPPAN